MSTLKLLLLFLSFRDLAAVKWSTSYSNRSVVCTGNRITLGWNFTVVSGETIEVIEWFFTPRTTHTRKSIAVFRNKQFTPASEYGTRLKQDGWIATLSGSTEADAGTYEVQITTSPKTRSDSTIRRDLVVDVAGPAVRNALTMNQYFMSDANGVYHVRLTCGEFTWPGQPPVGLVWQTPSNLELNSTGYEKGRFYLVLDNPIVGGNYVCRFPESVLPALCMTQDGLDHFLQASIFVDAVSARYVLIGAQIKKDKLKHDQDIQQVNEDNRQLAEQLQQMKADILKQDRLIQQLQGDNHNLAQQLQLTQANIGFHAKLNKNITLNRGEVVTFEAVMSNRGNGYDKSTGLFTAPVSGYYFFIYTVTPYVRGQWCRCILMANSDYLSSTKTKGDDSVFSPSTGHAVVFLAYGNKVGLYSGDDRSQFQYDSLFSGFLIGTGFY